MNQSISSYEEIPGALNPASHVAAQVAGATGPRQHAYIAFICCGAAVTELLAVGSSWQEGKERMDTAVPGVPDRRFLVLLNSPKRTGYYIARVR